MELVRFKDALFAAKHPCLPFGCLLYKHSSGGQGDLVSCRKGKNGYV